MGTLAGVSILPSGLIIEYTLENDIQYAILLVVLSKRESCMGDLPLMARNVLYFVFDAYSCSLIYVFCNSEMKKVFSCC